MVRSLAVVVFLLCSQRSWAQAEGERQANERCVEAMNDDQVELALADLNESFARQRLGASLWWSGWTTFNLINLGVGIERYVHGDTRLARDNWLVSIVGASIFVAEVSILPLPGLYGHRRLQRLPQGTAEEKRSKLRQGLTLLDKAALVETSNSNLTAHLAGLAFAVLSTGYVWIRNRDDPNGRLALALGLQFGTSVAFAEFTLWTVPRRARRTRQRMDRACGHAEAPALSFFASPLRFGVRF